MYCSNVVFPLNEVIPGFTYNVKKSKSNVYIRFVAYGYSIDDLEIVYNNSIITISTIKDYHEVKTDPKFSNNFPQQDKFYIQFWCPKISGINAEYSGNFIKLNCSLGDTSVNLGVVPIKFINEDNDVDILENTSDDTMNIIQLNEFMDKLEDIKDDFDSEITNNKD
ncbi:hypothetical protein F336_010 [Campylobacter phage F336]|uniref:Uncharacterized protein n=1 Tax=Campylobacter phage F336 TaxID=2794361 RepID=A0A7T3N3S4_9CAUD|nr:hypothetical protein F336_010 [Campylobacter phage F336]